MDAKAKNTGAKPATILIREAAEVLGVTLPSVVRKIRADREFPQRVVTGAPSNLLSVASLRRWCQKHRPQSVPKLDAWMEKRRMTLDEKGNVWLPALNGTAGAPLAKTLHKQPRAPARGARKTA